MDSFEGIPKSFSLFSSSSFAWLLERFDDSLPRLEVLDSGRMPARTVVAVSSDLKLVFWSASLRCSPTVVVPDANNHYEFLHGQRDLKRFPDRSYVLDDVVQDVGGSGIAVFMNSGGYFAGGVFRASRNGEMHVERHKTFRRYVTRKGQGGRETAHRSKRGTGKSRSAGGRLRAFNETKHKEQIQALLVEWADTLRGVSRIFLCAPDTNRHAFFFEGGPLSPEDERLRKVPLTWRRPTTEEVKRIAATLMTVTVLQGDDRDNVEGDGEHDDEEEEEEDDGNDDDGGDDDGDSEGTC